VTVMFTGAIVYGVHYTIPEYLCTFLITGGVSIFSLLKVKHKETHITQNFF
jgi:UDP-galactose transporter B1